MSMKREFFPTVRKTVMPRPQVTEKHDVLGQNGTAWATEAAIYGSNWQIDHWQGLIEVYGAGAAISFAHLLPPKNKYEKEGLYLRLRLAYRTTENANVNIRNFSGSHVDLPNHLDGNMYDDPECYWWLTDDLTLNINSIYSGEKLWIQRVDWEWMSKEVVYEDEATDRALYLDRKPEEIHDIYAPEEINQTFVQNYLIEKIKTDEQFAKRCLAMLHQDQVMDKDLTQLFLETGVAALN